MVDTGSASVDRADSADADRRDTDNDGSADSIDGDPTDDTDSDDRTDPVGGVDIDARDRWLRLRVPFDGGDDETFSPANVPVDLGQSAASGGVTGIELAFDSVESVEDVAALFDAFEDRDVRIGKLVVEIL